MALVAVEILMIQDKATAGGRWNLVGRRNDLLLGVIAMEMQTVATKSNVIGLDRQDISHEIAGLQVGALRMSILLVLPEQPSLVIAQGLSPEPRNVGIRMCSIISNRS